jgi:hypothetical protein
VWPTDLAGGLAGALIKGEGVLPGTRVVDRIGGDTVTLSQKLAPSFVPDPMKVYTYAFYGPVTTNGMIDPASAPTKITGLDSDQIALLAKIGAGLVVTGPGIQTAGQGEPPIVTLVLSIDVANRSVVLDKPLVAGFKAGTYRYTFS